MSFADERIAIYPDALRRIDGALNFAASWWEPAMRFQLRRDADHG